MLENGLIESNDDRRSTVRRLVPGWNVGLRGNLWELTAPTVCGAAKSAALPLVGNTVTPDPLPGHSCFGRKPHHEVKSRGQFADLQLSMPAQEGVRRDERLKVSERLSSEELGLRGQTAALDVGEPQPARTELLAQDAVLFLEVVDDVTLLLVDLAGDGHDEELKCLGKQRHTGASVAETYGGHEHRRPADLHDRISRQNGAD